MVIYLASLAVMLLTAFWTVNPFTNMLEHTFSTANFSQLFTSTYLGDHPAHGRDRGRGRDGHRRDRRAPVRLLHGAGRERARTRRLLFTAVMLPLWASYLATRLSPGS